jgi:hypothetical protein
VRRSAAALAAALVLAVTGCGSTVLSSPQLRADASRICTVTRRGTDRIPVPTKPAGGASFLRRGDTSLKAELTALRRLQPPKAAAAEYRAAIDAIARELQILQEALTNVQHGGDPLQIFRSVSGRLRPLEVRANGVWTALQIPACVER